MKLSRMKVDTAAEAAGVWKEFGADLAEPGESVIRVLIARLGRPEFKEWMQAQAIPHRQVLNAGGEEAERIMEDILKRAIAKFVVLDWENVEDDDGAPIPCTEENVYAIISDLACHDFYTWIQSVSGAAATYRAKQAEEDAGNSDASSGGTSNGDPSPSLSNGGQSEESSSVPGETVLS